MRSGSMKVFVAGWAMVFFFGVAMAPAQQQLPIYSLGTQSSSSSSQQQGSCNPSDPSCASYNPVQIQQPDSNSSRNGIVLDNGNGQSVNTQLSTQPQQQLQPQQTSLPLDAPTEFQQMV